MEEGVICKISGEGGKEVTRPLAPRSLRVFIMRNYQVFRVFRVRELAGRSGSSSETPPLNPPRRSKEVGVAHRHNSR